MRPMLVTLITVAGLTAPALASTILVGNKFEGTVSSIDLESGQEFARSSTGGSPHELALSPDGHTAVVVSYLDEGYVGEELNVFDMASAILRDTISTAPHRAPHGIAWLAGSDDVIATTENTRDVIQVDIDRGEVTGVAPTSLEGSHLLAVSPDAGTAFVTSRGSDKLSVIDTETMRLRQTIAAGEAPEAVDVSPDGQTLWVGNNKSEDIYVFDIETMDRLAHIEAGFLPIRGRFHPEGHAVAVADLCQDRIVVYDSESHDPIAEGDLTAVGVQTPASLPFAPDGSSLFIGAQASCNVVEIDTRHWTVNRVLSTGDGADGLAYSDIAMKV